MVVVGLLAVAIASSKFDLKLDALLLKKFKFMAFDGAFLNNLRSSLLAIFGFKPAEILTCALGKEGARPIQGRMGRIDQVKLAELSRAFRFRGLRLKPLNGDKLEAILHQPVEAAGVKADKPICRFTRVFLAGSLGALAGLRAAVAEEECAAKGGQLCKLIEKGRIHG